MTIAEKLTAVAENQQKVFDAGKQAEYDRFWDTIQNKGSTDGAIYENRFWKFPAELFKPKYDFIMNWDAYSANSSFRDMKATDMIKNCDFTRMTAVGLTYTFYQCTNLVNARTIKVASGVKYNATFGHCPNLEEIRFEGVIGQNGLDFSSSTKLSHDSLMSIINALENKTSGTWTLTIGTDNLAKLTDAEKAIATQKGWTLA